MAGEGVVGVLKAVLGLDTAQFEDGAKKAANAMGSFGTQMKAVFAGVGLERIVERVFDAIAHQFKESITHAFKFADEMGKMAQKVGISVEELTGLKLAADLADVNIETLSKSLGILSKNMVAAASGNKELSEKFKQLGIDVRDGEHNIKSVTQVLSEMADKFEGTKDGAVKVEAALKLLGRGGKELIPLLNEGGGSLKEFAAIAERMGLVVSQKTANQTQKFNDDIKLLKLSMEGLANQVVAQLIPGLLRMSGHLADGAKDGDRMKSAANFITEAFKQMVGIIIISIETIRLFDDVIKILGTSSRKGTDEIGTAITENIAKPLNKGINIFGEWLKTGLHSFKSMEEETSKAAKSFDDAGDEAKAFGDRTVKSISAADIELRKIPERIREFQELLKAGNVAGFVEKLFEAFSVGARRSAKDLDDPLNKNMEKLNDHIKHLRMQALDASGVFGGQVAAGFLGAASGMEALKGQITIVRDRLLLLGPDAQKLNIEMAKLEAFKLNVENLAPLDLLALKLDHINFLQKEAGLSAQAAANLQIKAAGDVLLAYGTAAQNIVGGFASAFKDLASMNKKYAGAAKALAIGEALVQTYLGAIKAYTATITVLGPIGAAVAAAAAVAAGLANVAKISATQFAQGGSFKVGGVGGIDSQTIAMNLTPGEMVDVRKPGSERTTTSEITVNMRGRDIFTGDAIRDLFNAINQGTSDGYRLKVA